MKTRLALPMLVLLACEASSSSGPGDASTLPDGGSATDSGVAETGASTPDAGPVDGGPDATPDGSRPDAGGDAGVCAPAWDGTLAMPASGIRWVTGWDQISPTVPKGSTLGLDGTSAGDVWFSGEVVGGTGKTSFVGHYDGTTVRALAGLPNVTWPVAVVSPTEAWLGPELRYRAGNLERAAKPAPGTTAMKFFGSNEGWSIGAGGVWRWDGTDWTAYGKLGAVVPFTAIDGASATDVWVAAGPLLKHWDGTAWSDPTALPPAGTDIRMIHAFSATDVWISGPATYRFDGTAWQPWIGAGFLDVESNGTVTYGVRPGGIGIAQGTAFTTSNGNVPPCQSGSGTGACSGSYMPTTGELFLGVRFPTGAGTAPGPYIRPAGATSSFNTVTMGRSVTQPATGPGDRAQLRQLTGGDVLAVAGGKLYRGRYDGAWTELTPPKIAGSDQVSAIVGETEDFMWIASTYGTTTTYLSRYDGTTFGPLQTTPIPRRARKYGATFGAGVDSVGNAILFDGTQWTATTENAVMVSPTEGYRITLSNGSRTSTIERGVSGVWTPQSPTLPAGDLFGFIDATSPTDVVAVSRKAAIFHWDGSSWTKLADGRTIDTVLETAMYFGAGRVWLNESGRGGPVRSFDGRCWKDELNLSGGSTLTGNRDRVWAWDVGTITAPWSDLRTRVP